jgi:hypothetical protein
MKRFIMPVVIIFIGVAWLLTNLEILPPIRWVLFLLFCGIGIFITLGFDKVTAVLGTFFIVCAVTAFMRQAEWLSWNIELPILVIIFGLLYLGSVLSPLPYPAWWREKDQANPKGRGL